MLQLDAFTAAEVDVICNVATCSALNRSEFTYIRSRCQFIPQQFFRNASSFYCQLGPLGPALGTFLDGFPRFLNSLPLALGMNNRLTNAKKQLGRTPIRCKVAPQGTISHCPKLGSDIHNITRAFGPVLVGITVLGGIVNKVEKHFHWPPYH